MLTTQVISSTLFCSQFREPLSCFRDYQSRRAKDAGSEAGGKISKGDAHRAVDAAVEEDVAQHCGDSGDEQPGLPTRKHQKDGMLCRRWP